MLTLSRLAGVSSRIFGNSQHEEALQRNMAEWNLANFRLVQEEDSNQAMPAGSAAVDPSTSPISSRSGLLGKPASPYLSDVPAGVDSHNLSRFAPSFSRDHTHLQFMRIENRGLDM